jgi:RsiW-degrading membrane proteinase PrsW (M82 family)
MVANGMGIQKPKKALAWLKILLVGGLLYVASLVILVISNNPNLFPTVVMIGNFLIPIAYVAFFYERRHFSQLSMPTTAFSFFYGGILGVLAASILEPIFIRSMDPASVLLVGVIEESVKILGVLVIARRMRHNSEMEGLILGAAAGMGFAALESMGYTFTAFLASGGSLTATVYVTMLRGILSPVGHGTWTAILASVLFRESYQNRFHINWKVIVAFLGVALLHALWDGLPAMVAPVLSTGFDVFVAQTLIGGIGFLVLWLRWRDARRLQNAQLIQIEPLIVNDGQTAEANGEQSRSGPESL